jgi:hypothetical protein
MATSLENSSSQVELGTLEHDGIGEKNTGKPRCYAAAAKRGQEGTCVNPADAAEDNTIAKLDAEYVVPDVQLAVGLRAGRVNDADWARDASDETQAQPELGPNLV